MIIWLASYPKSGNTLLRAMLSAYLFSENGNFNFELLNNIKQFPAKSYYENLEIDISNRNELIKNSLIAQAPMGKVKSAGLLKTHSSLFNFNKKYPFTDLHYSLGVVYIVRDPRNVVLSYARHLNISIEETMKFMTLGNGVDLDIMGSWSEHYKSWKNLKKYKRYLLVKYEDLVSNRDETFLKILKFIYKLRNTNFSLDKDRFKKMLDTTTFENLKNLEVNKGFKESKKDKNTGKNIIFFDKGINRNWATSLDSNISNNLEKIFKDEMNELGYK